MFQKTNKKGTAGLNVFLTVVSIIFVIGLIVYIIVISSSSLLNSNIVSESEDVSATTTNTILVNETGTTLTDCNANQGQVTNVTVVYDHFCKYGN